MNIKLTYSWILDYLETDCDPYDFAKYMSLCGPSFEKVEKKNDDYIFDIEITPNRIDTASAFGIAQEASAILPNFGIKACLKNNPIEKYQFPKILKQEDILDIKIVDKNLCSRFTTVVLKNVKVEKSPDLISKRLILCGIKSINNVVDISNYIMLSIGQPCHIFDYEKIKNSKITLRKSKKGEKIQLLDSSLVNLLEDDIVIEDGSSSLIDLCGIMGGLNSSVSAETKKVVLFIQTYNKQNIRRTSMRTGIRTVAATYFEKELDEERVEIGVGMGIELLKKYAKAEISSKIYDIYPKQTKPSVILLSKEKVDKLIGIKIDEEKKLKILTDLGFLINKDRSSITVPFWRKNDIKEENDLIEEIARINGYFNLPSELQPFTHITHQKNIDEIFRISSRIRNTLKNIGVNENINYSMISENLIEDFNLNKNDHLKIKNPISKDLKYLRKFTIPSLVVNIKNNQTKKDYLKFFEISKVFFKRNNNLPDEIYKLGIVTNTDYLDIKGIIERILSELNILNCSFDIHHENDFSDKQTASISINKEIIGFIGRLKSSIGEKLSIKKNVFISEINLLELINNYKHLPKYKKPISFAVIKLDLTDKIKNFEEFKNKAFSIAKNLIDIKVKDTYKDSVNLRLFFSSRVKNLTEKEALVELEEIKKIIK